MNRPVFTKCTMVINRSIRIARTIKHCLAAVRSIARTSRARSSVVSKWVGTCVNTAPDVHGVASQNAAVDRIASTANNVHSAASQNAAAGRIASTAHDVHSAASRNAAAGRIASTAHDVHGAASRNAAAGRIASMVNNVHSVASRNAVVAVGIASTSRVTVRRNSATGVTCVLRKGTLYTYAENDDTRRS